MKFYTVAELGPSRKLTPEGFLLCEGVRLARTGTLLYGAGEVPIEPGPDGMVRIERHEAEVFRPETLASINGKPFVDDHPDDDVTPATWRKVACGTILNPRRGTGTEDVFLLGDILVTEPDAIAAIDEGKREISLGYDAAYHQLEPGLGLQRNIIVNHAALVDKGRCGPACAIGDSEMSVTPTKKTVRQVLAELFATKDDAAFAKALDEDMGGLGGKTDGLGGTTINLTMGGGSQTKTPDEASDDPNEKRFKGIEDSLKAIGDKLGMGDAAADDPDDDTSTADAAPDAEALAEMHKSIAANAEILSPGFKVPTLDAKAKAKDAKEQLCKCQRKVLDRAYGTEDGKAAIEPFLAGKTHDFDTLSAATIDAIFNGAATIMGQQNNDGLRSAYIGSGGRTEDGKPHPLSPAGVNAANAAFWEKRSGVKH